MTSGPLPTLTDDEVAAIAVQRGAAWPTPLPTVEDDEQSLLAAVMRGRRSMLLRGLVTVDDEGDALPSPGVLACADAVLGVNVQLAAYVGRDDLSSATDGVSYYWYGDADAARWMTERIDGEGVHSFAWLDRADAVDAAARLADATYAEGVGGAGAAGEARLVVLRPGEPTLALVASHGRFAMVTASVTQDGRPLIEPDSDVDSARAGLQQLGVA